MDLPNYGSMSSRGVPYGVDPDPRQSYDMAEGDRTYLVPTEDDLGHPTDDLHIPVEGAPGTPPEVGKGQFRSRGLSLDQVHEAVTLSWRHVNVDAVVGGGGICKKSTAQTKTILTDVSGIVYPGSLIAIMGASGAGKSSLINVLTQRNLAGLQVTGEVLVNGEQLGAGIQRVSAYVQQDDMFLGYITVREHLWFTAMLRMDSHIENSDRKRHVERVIQELGLTKCSDTLIGEPGTKKSISGGERKRLAFASEVLTNPALLFCDEPTSGLDSFMAASVVQTLKALAGRGKTILCTIHQPASEVFSQFDNLLLLAEGKVAYMGKTSGAMELFSKLGHPCPMNYNPADHFIATLAISPDDEITSHQTVSAIVDANTTSDDFRELMQQVDSASQDGADPTKVATITSGSPYKASFCRQFGVVTWRSWTAHYRDPVVLRARFGQSVIMAILFGLIYLQQKYDQKGVTNINGALFLLQIGGSLAYVFGVVNTFPKEYPVILREHQNGMYTIVSFFLSKVIAELPTFVITPAIMATIAYWMIGLYPAAEQFAIFVAVLVLIANVAVSFGYMTSCLSDNVTVVLTITPLVQTPLMLFGGFFLNSGSIPWWLIWIKYISWFSYANEILVVNQWKLVTNITCNVPAVPTRPSLLTQMSMNMVQDDGPAMLPCFQNGEMVIRSMSFDQNNVNFDFIMLGVLLVGFKILAFIFLEVRTRLKK